MTQTTLALAEPAIDYSKTVGELMERMDENEIADAYEEWFALKWARAHKGAVDIIIAALSKDV